MFEMLKIGIKASQRLPSRRFTLYCLPIMFIFIAAYLLGMAFTPGVKAAGRNTYYISKNGNNADGLSWATAWNELNKINWSLVQPGDTLLLDGGSRSMTYTTTLTIGKSGTRAAPIMVKRAADAGHNGQVILFGGRSILLPYCGQANYTYRATGTINHGIVMGANSWVIIDGGSWHGMSIYGFDSHGVDMTSNPGNDTLRNLEIYDNGSASQSGGSWNPNTNGHGVFLNGSNLTFENMDIHDNSDDEFDTGVGSIDNITIRSSWLHVTREDPNNPGLPFNQCVHQDGYQIYSGGTEGGILFENDIIGPGLKEGTILGNTPQSGNAAAAVNNVTIRNSLFLNKVINIMGYPQVQESGWVLDHDTVFTPGSGTPASTGVPGGTSFFLQGSNNTVTNSIFYEGQIYLPNGLAAAAKNCQWRTTGNTSAIAGQTVDPQFVTDVSSYNFSTPLNTIANANFALQATSPCKGSGSSITSLKRFLQLVGGTRPPSTLTPTPETTQNPVQVATSAPTGSGKAGEPAHPGSSVNGYIVIVGVVAGILILTGALWLLVVFYRKR